MIRALNSFNNNATTTNDNTDDNIYANTNNHKYNCNKGE